MEISDSVKTLGRRLGVELDSYGFCHTTLFDPLQTSRDGIYVAGPFREPKDIPETVMEASGAAANVSKLLSSSRHSLALKANILQNWISPIRIRELVSSSVIVAAISVVIWMFLKLQNMRRASQVLSMLKTICTFQVMRPYYSLPAYKNLMVPLFSPRG